MSDDPYQPDTQQHTLRDRIANALYQELSIELPAAIRGANAVIQALGLKVEYGMGDSHDYSDDPEIHPVSKSDMERRSWYGEDFTYRYVTEWEPNE
jgi:hypothetical protein